jgi:predicted acetyltransferase
VTVRPVEPADEASLIALKRDGFGYPSSVPNDAFQKDFQRSLPWLRGVEQDGRLVATAKWLPFKGYVAGRKQTFAALAAVTTAPEARRRGHVRTLIEDGLREQHEQGVAWSTQHPFDARFYARLGYHAFDAGVALNLPIEWLPGDPRDVVFERQADGATGWRALQEPFASKHSFSLLREDPWRDPSDLGSDRWGHALEPDDKDAAKPVVYATASGGYAAVALNLSEREPERQVLEVLDLAWRDAASRRDVLALLKTWQGQVGRVKLELPATDPFSQQTRARFSLPRAVVQARIVNVTAALSGLPRTASTPGGRFTFAVRDALAPWNNGTWTLDLTGESTDLMPSTHLPDAHLPVRSLAALLSGTPPVSLLSSGDAEGDPRVLAALASLHADHPPFLPSADSF